MSASQRTKGAAGERECAGIISEALGVNLKRNLGQAREGGDDLTLPKFGGGRFRCEVKRRRSISVWAFLKQAIASCHNCVEGDDVPIVFMRADGGEWMALMRMDDFLPMLGGELGTVPAAVAEKAA